MRQGSDASDISCQDKLRKLGIQQKQHQKVFLDTVFGKQGVCQGILHANTKDELQEKLTASRELLETEETRTTGRKVPHFWQYVNSHKEMIEKCMVRDARKRAGMHVINLVHLFVVTQISQRV